MESRQEEAVAARPSLRERNKAKRRDAIIDSCIALLRVHPIGDVSIERIAEVAEVAPATVYNLVGSREQLLLACIDRVIERLVDSLVRVDPAQDPIGAAQRIVDESVDAFTAEPDAYRQIIGALGDFSRTRSMMAIDPAQLQIAAMREAHASGILRADADPVAVGRQIYLSYNGALFSWAGLGLTDDGLGHAARHGLWTTLAAFASDAHRSDFVERACAIGRSLTSAGWGEPSAAHVDPR